MEWEHRVEEQWIGVYLLVLSVANREDLLDTASTQGVLLDLKLKRLIYIFLFIHEKHLLFP